MPDVSKRRRVARGTPHGGEFADEDHGASDDSDLEVGPVPAGPDPVHLTDADTLMLERARGADLQRALDMDDPRIDRRLAFNPNMDWEGLNALLDRQPTRADRLHVFNGMCMNRASADRLADLYERSRKLPAADRRMAWTCMAKNRRLDPHVAHRMALALGTGRTTGDASIAATLAYNPNTAGETLALLADKYPDDRYLLALVIDNPNANDYALLMAANRTDDNLARMEAWSRIKDVHRLEEADMSDEWVVRGIRANDDLPHDPDELRRLAVKAGMAGDRDPELAVALAKHPDADGRTLGELAHWNNPFVQDAVLNNPNVTDSERRLVADNTADPATRQWAWRSMTEPESLMKADVTDRDTLIGACLNPHIDERAATRLARDGGGVAVGYLRDNETLDPVFRDMLDDM